jgi:sugar lactone lactonase YvrE
MDVFYDLPSDLPQHLPPPLTAHPTRVLTTWPVGTFVENLLIRENGDIIVSLHSENRLERIAADGQHETFATLPAPPTSLIEFGDALFVFGGAPGQPPAYLWKVTGNGSVELRAKFADALFLNGSAPFFPGAALVVDSLRGEIFQVSLESGEVTVWFSHELLTKVTTFPLLPGGNGLQIFDRHVYVSNTDRALFLRIPLRPDGGAGEIDVVADQLRADDFAFDTDGSAYLTTHIENSLVRLSPGGERAALAGAEQGMPGCTAARFGRTPETTGQLFVTTTGGLIGPYQGVAQEAKLLVIDTDAAGAPITALTPLEENR